MYAVRSKMIDAQRLVRGLLAALAFALPIIYLPGVTYDPVNLPKLSTALLLVGAAAAVCIYSSGCRDWKRGGLYLPALSLGSIMVLSWALEPNRNWTLLGQYPRFQGLLPYLLCIVIGLLVAAAFTDSALPLVRAIAGAGAVVALYAGLQFVGLDPFRDAVSLGGYAPDLAPTTTAISTLGNPNFTGHMLAISLPLALFLWTDGLTPKWLAMAQVVLIAEGLLLTFSYGAWAAAAAAVFTFLSARWWSTSPLLGRVLAGAAAMMPVLLVATVVYGMFGETSGLDTSASYRGYWWRSAIRMIPDAPLLGGGPDAFAHQHVHYRLSEDAIANGVVIADDPHSVPLAITASFGLLGGVAFLAVAAWALSSLQSMGGDRRVRIALVAASAAYFTQSLVTIDEPAIRFTFWIVLGGIAATLSRPVHPLRRSGTRVRRKPARLLAATAVCLVSGAVAIQLVTGDLWVRRGAPTASDGSAEAQLSALRTAIEIRDDPAYRRLYAERLGQAALETRSRATAQAMRTAFSYVDAIPDVWAKMSRARLLYYLGQEGVVPREVALMAYEDLLTVDPWNSDLRTESARLLMEMGRSENAAEALAALKRAAALADVVLDPSYWGTVAVSNALQGSDVLASEASQHADACSQLIVKILQTDAEPNADGSGQLQLCGRSTWLHFLALLEPAERERWEALAVGPAAQ